MPQTPPPPEPPSPAAFFDNPLPSSEEGERAILGAVLLNNTILDTLALQLQPADMYSPVNRRIYEAMLTLHDAGRAVDPILVAEELKRNGGSAESMGGVAAIANLTYGLPQNLVVDEYVEEVTDAARRRRLMQTLNAAAQALNNGAGFKEVTDHITGYVDGATTGVQAVEIRDLSTLIDGRIEASQAMQQAGTGLIGLSTGLIDVDMLTLGYQRKDLIIKAGRPSMGKTACAMCISQNVAFRGGGRVLVASLEMGWESLTDRVISSEAMVDSRKFRAGLLNHQEWDRVHEAQAAMHQGNLLIYDKPAISPAELRGVMRRVLRQEDRLDLVVVDYIQLMTGPRSENRTQEVTKISSALKSLAKEFDVPVVAISQLSRAPEGRSANGHRPMLSDLRESGAIEQDADLVVFMYREDYYPKADGTTQGEGTAEFIVAKQRNGPTDTVMLSFQREFTKFGNYVTDF
jgi:replicative DNA helicase